MATVDHDARDNRVRHDEAYWIYVFANVQCHSCGALVGLKIGLLRLLVAISGYLKAKASCRRPPTN